MTNEQIEHYIIEMQQKIATLDMAIKTLSTSINELNKSINQITQKKGDFIDKVILYIITAIVGIMISQQFK